MIDYPLSFAEWEQMIETAHDAFRTTPLKKVVLSRICQVRSRPRPSTRRSPGPVGRPLSRLLHLSL